MEGQPSVLVGVLTLPIRSPAPLCLEPFFFFQSVQIKRTLTLIDAHQILIDAHRFLISRALVCDDDKNDD